MGAGLQGFPGWGERRPSCVGGEGEGCFSAPRPSPGSEGRTGGGPPRGGGRFRCLQRPVEWLRVWREGPFGPSPRRLLAGLWGSVPPRPGPPTSFLGLRDFNCSPDITAQTSPWSLMRQGPMGVERRGTYRGDDLWSRCTYCLYLRHCWLGNVPARDLMLREWLSGRQGFSAVYYTLLHPSLIIRT